MAHVLPSKAHPASESRQGEQVTSLMSALAQAKLIAIVRSQSEESAVWAATQVLEAGFQVLEVPFTVPHCARVIETLCQRFPDAVIGAGTVLEARQALEALGAGAQFLVAPTLVEPLIQLGQEQDILVLPGCMTPTEIYKAHTLGAPVVKFFPAQAAGGAGFLQALKGPLPHIPIVPTGGILLEHVAGYLKAGALAVGVGGPLLPTALVESRDTAAIQKSAKAYLQARDAQ